MKMLRIVALIPALAICHVATAAAQVIGSGTLKGPISFTVKKCGTDRGRVQLVLTVAPDGTWTAGSDEGLPLSGTSQPLGTSGRKLTLDFDDESEADFVAQRASDIEVGCRVSGVAIDAATPAKFTLTLNRKRTRATLAVIYTLTGSAGGGRSKAIFRLKGSGRWTPA